MEQLLLNFSANALRERAVGSEEDHRTTSSVNGAFLASCPTGHIMIICWGQVFWGSSKPNLLLSSGEDAKMLLFTVAVVPRLLVFKTTVGLGKGGEEQAS